MDDNKNNFVRASSSRRILSDVVAPKQSVAAEQIFRPPTSRLRPQKKRSVSKHWKSISLIFLLLVGWIVFSVNTNRIEIQVVPRSSRLAVNKLLSFTTQPNDTSKIFLRTFAVGGSREGIFEGKITTAPVSRKATGTVVIFNKSSQAPQVLVANTRLQTPDGKIFRISRAITVPGYTVQNKEIVPGSKEIDVVADKPGEEYNIGVSDFTIPGFSGSPKFNTIFGRSKSPMQGGFSGVEKSVTKDDLQSALIKLNAEGEAESFALAKSKIPVDSILIKQSIEYVVTDQSVSFVPDQGDGKFKLTIKDEIRGAMIDKEQLLKFFDDAKLPAPFRIINPDDLSLAMTGYQYEGSSGQIRVTGNADLESLIDSDAIRNFIVKDRRAKSSDILGAFSQLSSVEVRFRPFWFQYPPTDLSRIDIILATR